MRGCRQKGRWINTAISFGIDLQDIFWIGIREDKQKLVSDGDNNNNNDDNGADGANDADNNNNNNNDQVENMYVFLSSSTILSPFSLHHNP